MIAGGKLVERIRSLTFAKVVHQEISWFDDPDSGAVGARLWTNASTVKSLVGDALVLIVQKISTIPTGLVVAFTANWILAFIVSACVTSGSCARNHSDEVSRRILQRFQGFPYFWFRPLD